MGNYWWGNDLIHYFSSSYTTATLCDGTFHTITASFDGTTRRIHYDGVQLATSDMPSPATHANVNTNFCLGGEDPSRGYGYEWTGSLRNLQVFTDNCVARAPCS